MLDLVHDKLKIDKFRFTNENYHTPKQLKGELTREKPRMRKQFTILNYGLAIALINKDRFKK